MVVGMIASANSSSISAYMQAIVDDGFEQRSSHDDTFKLNC